MEINKKTENFINYMNKDSEKEEILILNHFHMKVANALGVTGLNVDNLKKNMLNKEENSKNIKRIIQNNGDLDVFFV